MEDSYTVHRRRKAAARKREKTPEPPKRRPEDVTETDDDEQDARARIERMVQETEMLEVLEENERIRRFAEVEKTSENNVGERKINEEKSQRALKRAMSPDSLRRDDDDEKPEDSEKLDKKSSLEVSKRENRSEKSDGEARSVERKKTSGVATGQPEVESRTRDWIDETMRKSKKDDNEKSRVSRGPVSRRRRDIDKDFSPEILEKSALTVNKKAPSSPDIERSEKNRSDSEMTARESGESSRDIVSSVSVKKTSSRAVDEVEQAMTLDENRYEQALARDTDDAGLARSSSGKNLKNDSIQRQDQRKNETDQEIKSSLARKTLDKSTSRLAEDKVRKREAIGSPPKSGNFDSRDSTTATSSKRSSKDRNNDGTGYTTDSSETEETAKRVLRRKKSPENGKLRSTSAKKIPSRSRPTTDTDGDVEDQEHQRKRSDKKSTSRRRPSSETDDDYANSNKNGALGSPSSSREKRDLPRLPSRMTDKTRNVEKKTTIGRSRYSSDVNDEDSKTMTKSETFPLDTTNARDKAPSIGRSTSEIKKQIIPLSDDSLIEDFERAQRDYMRKERSILDHDPMDDYVDPRMEAALRRRKFSIIQTETEVTEVAQQVQQPEKKSWLAWLPIFGKRVTKEKLEDERGASIKEKISSDEDKLSSRKKKSEEEKKNLNEKTIAPKRVSFLEFFRTLADFASEFRAFVEQNPRETRKIRVLRNRCVAELLLAMIYCGLGAFVFRFTEGAFETFYKCGVKRVKRDFLDSLWNFSHNMREEDWKSMARRKLMEFEEQLHTAHEAGVHSYSGQKSWSFLNAVVYCLTVITTIGYGHISPSTTTGRAITIVYAIFGIPMFLIILADFGKLFTRGIKFLWAFVRRVYYTGSCRRVRRTVPVQEVMKGVQLVYDLATFRRPSQMNPEEIEEMEKQQNQTQTVLNLDGNAPPSGQPDTPGTPALSTFAIDDEFNLPISVAIVILLAYIFVGATVYNFWEQWGFFESFYFVFISMSTIGFGDYVPKHPIYMMLSIVYLVFGLALTSMCINVVQVMLSDSFKQASQKIGATIGFEVTEDDGSVHPAAPPTVEIADVHTTIKESESEEQVAPKAKQEDVEL